jgi:hypothetical protein
LSLKVIKINNFHNNYINTEYKYQLLIALPVKVQNLIIQRHKSV